MAELGRKAIGWIGAALDSDADASAGAAISRRLRPGLGLGTVLLTLSVATVLAALWEHRIVSWICCGLTVLFAVVSGWVLGVWRLLRDQTLLASQLWTSANHLLAPGYLRRGFFRGDDLERFIDRCLKESPRFKDYAGQLGDAPLTFGWVSRLVEEKPDEDLEEIVPLILTTTNLTSRALILIRSYDDQFQALPVARAVRASAGFPVFFRPVELACPGLEGWYVDGGMISNFPAWVFSRELRRRMAETGQYRELAIRPWLNIGLRVVPDPTGPASPDQSPREFVRSLFDLARGQVRNELENALAAQLPRAISILQPTSQTNAPPNLLDVDRLDDDKITAMFARGRDFAEEELSRYSFDLPSGAEASAIEQALERVVRRVLRSFGRTNDVLKLRANVFVPREQKLVLAYAQGMGGDADRGLEFDHNAGLTGFCFVSRRPYLCNLHYTRRWAEEVSSPDAELLGMNREAHLSVREDRTWLASVPVFDPADCWFVDSEAAAMPHDPKAQPIWVKLPGTLDGAVFAVLNLDAAVNYGELDLPEDPAESLTDPRISSILHLLQACSFEIGRIFSRAFARKRER